MARARSKKGRLNQVHRWLQAVFPTPYPTALKVITLPRGDSGDCTRQGRQFTIRIHNKLLWTSAIEILLHEYAHAMSWPMGKLADHEPDHNDAWGLAYAKLYRAFQEEGGDVESWLY